MKRIMYIVMLLFVTSTSLISFSGCRDTRSTGEKVEDAVDDAGDKIEEGAEEVGDEIDDATDDDM